LTEQIAHDYADRFSRISLVPSSGGVFEVRVNGREIYSKKRTGAFPDQEAIVVEVGTLLPSST
jgi:selenoprotein W-related protein